MIVETQLTFPSERLGRLAEQAIHPLRTEIQDALLAYRIQDAAEGANPLFLAVERYARRRHVDSMDRARSRRQDNRRFPAFYA